MAHAESQTSVEAKQTRIKAVIYTEFERDLVPHPCLRCKTQRELGARIAISLLDEQELQNSGLKPSAQVEILPSQRPQDASSVCKASGQALKFKSMAQIPEKECTN